MYARGEALQQVDQALPEGSASLRPGRAHLAVRREGRQGVGVGEDLLGTREGHKLKKNTHVFPQYRNNPHIYIYIYKLYMYIHI